VRLLELVAQLSYWDQKEKVIYFWRLEENTVSKFRKGVIAIARARCAIAATREKHLA